MSELNPVKEPDPASVEPLIQTLWADLPTLFERDISYDIYSKDIYFRDPVNTFKGKLNYRIIFWTLRFHARLFFTTIAFDLHSIAHPQPDTILATWTVRGTLRVPWKADIFFNGDSTYKLNQQGKIYQHIDRWDRVSIEILRQFLRRGQQNQKQN